MSSGFLELVSASHTADAPELLRSARRDGVEQFGLLGLPSTKLEDWKYTSVSSIANASFAPVSGIPVSGIPVSGISASGATGSVSRDAIATFLFGQPSWPLVVFVNGVFSPALSSMETLPDGVRVMELSRASVEEPDLLQRHLGSTAPAGRDGFTALNTALLGTGTLVHVAKEMVSDIPVHLLHVADGGADGVLASPRHLIVVERHAKATVVESFVTLGQAAYFTNAVTEAIIEDGATLQHVRVQRESERAYHVGTIEARQGRDSHFVSFSLVAGAALSRTNVYTVLAGDGCGTTLNGLFLLDGTQHGDTQTRVEHVAPNCFSRELYKCLLDGSSHGVFNGKVYVHPAAQKTDGKQTNNTLLLSDKAHIDTKPQLEIFADDVKCTHGATVGRIDETALFYLKSRGINNTLARQLLMYAFAADVLETIENESVRHELEGMTLKRFTGA